MNYEALFDHAGRRRVRAAVLGAGSFGTGVIAGAGRGGRLETPVVADKEIARARQALAAAGWSEAQIVECADTGEARRALDAGRAVATADASIVFGLPLDIVVEATGEPESAARHAFAAIERRMHVAMVTKEADVVVGPMLKSLADAAGVVYTAVDGDQHGLIIGLVSWARVIGLEVRCAGKGLDGEVVYDVPNGRVQIWGTWHELAPGARRYFEPSPEGAEVEFVAARREALGAAARAGGWDLTELTIAANATGLPLNAGGIVCPPVYATEIARVLTPRAEGGLLDDVPAIDAVALLRQPHETTLGGGVFLVGRMRSDVLVQTACGKSQLVPSGRGGEAMLVLRPMHLLGVEAAVSILSAAVLGVPTGAREYRPTFDRVIRARRALKAGGRLGGDHSPDLAGEAVPAVGFAPDDPIPAHLAEGNSLAADVPAGEWIRRRHVRRPPDSALWVLRERQDALFAPGANRKEQGNCP